MTHMINPKITHAQKFLIIGTILGGSSIVRPKKGKNCYLSMRNKDMQWLKFKSEQIKDLASPSPMTIEKTNRWHSVCYPLFNDFYAMFYENGKRKLKEKDLQLLHDSSMAIWYGDSGKYNGKNIIFNTHIWGESGTQLINEYFESLDWSSFVFLERKNHRIKLDKKSSEEFIKITSQYLPEYKKFV